MTYVVIAATADQVTVKNAKINRGNSCPSLRWYGNGSLKYGQSLKDSNMCDPDRIKEVTVETDQGDYTFNFQDAVIKSMILIVIVWLAAALLIGNSTKNHGCNFWPWFGLSIVIEPMLAYLILKLKSMSWDLVITRLSFSMGTDRTS